MEQIKFTKLHGLGNDYLYVDMIRNKYSFNPSELSKKISDRHFGVGSDGLILVLPSEKADFGMRIFNADGSEAEMCGNGIRAFAKYCYDSGLTKSQNLKIETGAGVKKVELNVSSGVASSAKVDMGEPILEGEKIPVAIKKNPVLNEKIDVANESFLFSSVSMGNPHCIIFVDEITDRLVKEVGPKIEVHKLFPKKVNVEFAKVIDEKNVEMRVWERGSGETMACGTGACAVAVASSLSSKTGKKVNIHLLGGKLEIEWKDDNHVYMTGPAEKVFEGTYVF